MPVSTVSAGYAEAPTTRASGRQASAQRKVESHKLGKPGGRKPARLATNRHSAGTILWERVTARTGATVASINSLTLIGQPENHPLGGSCL